VETTAITDGLALWLLAARIVQSTIHFVSTNVVAVGARFTVFAVQMAIGIYWVVIKMPSGASAPPRRYGFSGLREPGALTAAQPVL
jgi:hypothetical protein